MRITTVTSNRAGREVTLYRPNQDRLSPYYGDRRRHLVISHPYGMAPVDILAAVADELDDAELVELAGALGLERPGGAA
jgi:hypothetical protein